MESMSVRLDKEDRLVSWSDVGRGPSKVQVLSILERDIAMTELLALLQVIPYLHTIPGQVFHSHESPDRWKIE